MGIVLGGPEIESQVEIVAAAGVGELSDLVDLKAEVALITPEANIDVFICKIYMS